MPPAGHELTVLTKVNHGDGLTTRPIATHQTLTTIYPMTTATQEAVTTDESSAIAKPKAAGGRPAGYSPILPFTTGKLCKGLAENAFKEFVKLNELCESGKATSEDLTKLLIKQSVAGLEVRKAASLVWLTQGMLLHNLKDSIKADGKNWMDYFDQELSGPLNLSPRSEQLQRKMFTDWQQATRSSPEHTKRALEIGRAHV